MALPTLDVQFAPSAVASAGRSFILDISTLGTNTDPAVDLTGGTLAEGAVFKDITPYVRSFTTDRGRRRSLDRFGAGTATVVLDNRDRRFDPTNFSSEYANSILGITGVTPMRPVIINATWSGTSYPVFRGFIDSWSFDYDQSISDATATITLTDAFKVLAGPLGSLPTAPGFTSADDYDRIPSSAEVLIATADGDGLNVVPMSGTAARIGFVADVTVGTTPDKLVHAEKIQRLYVGNYGSANVSVINTASNTVSATVTVGSGPQSVAITPDGTKAYVNNYSAATVSVINTATNAVSATVTVGTTPRIIIANPRGTRVYVANILSNTVSVIDTSSNTVVETLGTLSQPYSLAINANGTRIYATAYAAAKVNVLADQSANLGTFNIPVVEGVEQTPAYGAENETTGQRIFRLLDEVGMQRSDLDEGNVRLIPQKVDATVLEMMQIAAESEPGDLFVDASGQIRFDDRYALIENTKSNTTQGTFDTTTLSNPFATVEVAYDDDLLYNIIKTTRYTVDPTKTESENPVLLGTTVTVSNPESQALYGARTLERRLPVPTDFGSDTTYGQDYLRDYGTFLMSIYSQPELRPASIRIMPQRSETTLFPQVLDREINDRITVKFNVPGGGTIEKDCFIDGVSHDVTPESWSTSFNLRSATQYTGFFILDSATVGLLDTNKLAF